MNSRKEISVEQLGELMSKRNVVSLIHRANQNNHLWAFRLPYMNVVKVPSDLRGYRELKVKGYEDLGIYISNN